MKELNYRDPVLARKLARRIAEIAAKLERPVRLMEVCGTHTHSIFHFGIRDLLPANVHLISGPGCPVCVTPVEFIDQALLIARQPQVIVATFGDITRVPGQSGSLLQAKAEGARVQVLYSPLDALELARENPEELVVFLAVGFETTTPLSALAIQQAEEEGLSNFALLHAHKLVPPALRALAEQDIAVDGFLLPGHVSVVIGTEPYRFLADEFGLPGVIVGFEPVEILHGILQLLESIRDGRAAVINAYGRVVRPEGNRRAQELIAHFFEPTTAGWRGLGNVPDAALTLREEWKQYDLLSHDDLQVVRTMNREFAGLAQTREQERRSPCICGQILIGRKIPPECPSFGSACQPDSPLGACMVSAEGTCAAYYRYQRRGGKHNVR